MSWLTPEAQQILSALERDCARLGGHTSTAYHLASVSSVSPMPREVSKVLAGERGRVAVELIAGLVKLCGAPALRSAIDHIANAAARPEPFGLVLPELLKLSGSSLSEALEDLLDDGQVSRPGTIDRLVELDDHTTRAVVAARAALRVRVA